MIKPEVYSLSSDKISPFIMSEFAQIKSVFSAIEGVRFEFDCMLVGAQAYNILYPERRLPTPDCDFLINVYSSCKTNIGLLICAIAADLSIIGGQVKSKIELEKEYSYISWKNKEIDIAVQVIPYSPDYAFDSLEQGQYLLQQRLDGLQRRHLIFKANAIHFAESRGGIQYTAYRWGDSPQFFSASPGPLEIGYAQRQLKRYKEEHKPLPAGFLDEFEAAIERVQKKGSPSPTSNSVSSEEAHGGAGSESPLFEEVALDSFVVAESEAGRKERKKAAKKRAQLLKAAAAAEVKAKEEAAAKIVIAALVKEREETAVKVEAVAAAAAEKQKTGGLPASAPAAISSKSKKKKSKKKGDGKLAVSAIDAIAVAAAAETKVSLLDSSKTDEKIQKSKKALLELMRVQHEKLEKNNWLVPWVQNWFLMLDPDEDWNVFRFELFQTPLISDAGGERLLSAYEILILSGDFENVIYMGALGLIRPGAEEFALVFNCIKACFGKHAFSLKEREFFNKESCLGYLLIFRFFLLANYGTELAVSQSKLCRKFGQSIPKLFYLPSVKKPGTAEEGHFINRHNEWARYDAALSMLNFSSSDLAWESMFPYFSSKNISGDNRKILMYLAFTHPILSEYERKIPEALHSVMMACLILSSPDCKVSDQVRLSSLLFPVVSPAVPQASNAFAFARAIGAPIEALTLGVPLCMLSEEIVKKLEGVLVYDEVILLFTPEELAKLNKVDEIHGTYLYKTIEFTKLYEFSEHASGVFERDYLSRIKLIMFLLQEGADFRLTPPGKKDKIEALVSYKIPQLHPLFSSDSVRAHFMDKVTQCPVSSSAQPFGAAALRPAESQSGFPFAFIPEELTFD